MYYYILEAAATRSVRQDYEKLRDILTELGITGEMVQASPARLPAELAEMGISRGYTTIVAVGGDSHISQVATALMGRAVLGVIPIAASTSISNLIGVATFREAAEALKQRRLISVSTVLVGTDLPIFLEGVIESNNLAKVSLIIDNRLRAFAYFNRLVINRQLEITLESDHLAPKKKILGIFSVGRDMIRSESLLHGKSIRLVTDPEMPLLVGGEKVAMSPLTLRLLPDSLKVIVRRATLNL